MTIPSGNLELYQIKDEKSGVKNVSRSGKNDIER